MATWDKICRVCASPAQYDIFSKIPAYLHAASNEFIGWQKTINILIEETTGIKVCPDDGLPKSICALCISYLKHAATFRDQVIKNTLSLQAIKKLRDEKGSNCDDKNSILITEQELCLSDTRNLANAIQNEKDAKVSKSLFQPPKAAPSQDYIIQQMRYLNLLFDKDINAGIAEVGQQCDNDELTANRPYVDPMADYETESTSNEENDGENFINSANLAKTNIFSYTEKNFEEDDIMNLDELRDAINVNIPENCKERKCRACFRRFMFEDSYEQHMENCIEYKFLNFIEEINLLLDIRRKKAVSPHEFIRRMIFSLRKICDFLKINCDEIMLPDELSINNEKIHKKQTSKSEEKENVDETILFGNEPQEQNSPVNFAISDKKDTNSYNLNDLLLSSPHPDKASLGTATPISIHNNILYEIERAQSSNAIPNNATDDMPRNINMQDNNNVKLMRPIPMHATPKSQPILQPQPSPAKLSEDERLIFMQKLEQLNVYQTPQQNPNQQSQLTTPSISVRKDLMPKSGQERTPKVPASPQYCSAACYMCNAIFETISDFELHNAMYHNGTVESATDIRRTRRTSDEERERIIAMFENEDEI